MVTEADEVIVAKIQSGETEKFGEIIDRYQKRLAGFIRKIIGNHDEVDDLVEDSLVAVYENIQDFDTKKKFSSWILRIAHNKTVDFIKKKKSLILSGEWDEIDKRNKLFEEVEVEREKKEKVSNALNKLELKYREVLILKYFEDKSYDEISDVLQTTVNNVGVMINRAKKKLKEVYEE
jgi:RNA polymerase sigma-70 factor (ECF subfamily)